MTPEIRQKLDKLIKLIHTPEPPPIVHPKATFLDPNKLKVRNGELAIIHEIASNRHLYKIKKEHFTKELLLEKDAKGNSVLHYAAATGELAHIPEEFHTWEYLSIRNCYGTTVYHFLAGQKKNAKLGVTWTTKLLELTDNFNTSVLCKLAQAGQLRSVPKELLTVKGLTQQNTSLQFALKHAAETKDITWIPKELLTIDALNLEGDDNESPLQIILRTRRQVLPKNMLDKALDIQPDKWKTIKFAQCQHKENLISITGEKVELEEAKRLVTVCQPVALVSTDPGEIGDRISVHPVGDTILALLDNIFPNMEAGTWLSPYTLMHIQSLKLLWVSELNNYPLGRNQTIGIISRESNILYLPLVDKNLYSEILPHATAAWTEYGNAQTLPEFLSEYKDESYTNTRSKGLTLLLEHLPRYIELETQQDSENLSFLEYGIQQAPEAVISAISRQKPTQRQRELFIKLGKTQLLEQCEELYKTIAQVKATTQSTEVSLF